MANSTARPEPAGARSDQLVLGMRQLALAAEAWTPGRRTGRAAPGASWRLPPVLPALAEERQRQLAAAVGDDRLEDRCRGLLRIGRVDTEAIIGLHGHVLAVAQRGQVGQLAPGLVPARVVAAAGRRRSAGREPAWPAAWPPCRRPPARADRSGSPSRPFSPVPGQHCAGQHRAWMRTSHGTARGRQRGPPGSRAPPAVGYPSSTGRRGPGRGPISLAPNGAIPWLPSATCAARGRASATTSRSHTAAPRAAGTRTSSASAPWSGRRPKRLNVCTSCIKAGKVTR